ncbi:glycerophosphodiester phosphodiesterase family protein [Pelagibacterium lentulum]|uniref:Glycerophosphoryl diester phosphodiesterase n=1 Tax=Pelagibacterium lentulum TaxID=2029865 RepID=A0A916RDM6_9HYPH|nr:glycerophosphodiester phosphodiesterase family protein [Pelagibacterium lentulum]GGA51968.1 glycerophosphoryl diester phosphodiesterase [Pelagibacterium lentulum]
MNTSPFARPVAHRGYHDRQAGTIENSRSAFEAAIAQGFGIECDLQLTQDNQAVVFHDDTLERLVGKDGRIDEIAATEICVTPLLGSADGDCPQLFSDFLEQIAGRTPLVVELKRQKSVEAGQRLAKVVAAAIKDYQGPLVLKSFDPSILSAVRKAGYNGAVGIITYDYRRPEWDASLGTTKRFVLRHLLHWPASRFTFVSCERTSLTLPMVRLCRALGMKVMSWTVKDKAHVPQVLQHADQIVFEGFDPDS